MAWKNYLKSLFEGNGPEIEITIILSIIGFTGISWKMFSHVLPMLVLLNNIGFHDFTGSIGTLLVLMLFQKICRII
jgi:hypothetical protein